VTVDGDGYLYFVGRKDKLIKSRGVRVSPEEIEACMYSSGFISHAVSFAAPGDGPEDDVIVAVVASDPDVFQEDLLAQFCKNEMPEYMRPHRIWRVDAMSLTSSGKPDRCRIQQLYVEHRQSTGTAARAARTA
jgi:acyl-CoA synthetase (AMP-forming)/AMP-acid ligase II